MNPESACALSDPGLISGAQGAPQAGLADDGEVAALPAVRIGIGQQAVGHPASLKLYKLCQGLELVCVALFCADSETARSFTQPVRLQAARGLAHTLGLDFLCENPEASGGCALLPELSVQLTSPRSQAS